MEVLQSSKECRLQIGEFCISLRFGDTDWAASVREYFQGFLCTKNPDLLVDCTIVHHKEWIEIPSSLMAEKNVNENQFALHSELLSGFLDLSKKTASVAIKYGLLKTARVFEQFLFTLYYTLLEEKYPHEKPNNYLLHACAVDIGGLGCIFTGRPGSGKSTVANLFEDYQVLNDEMVIVGKKNGKYRVKSTPFNGDFKKKVNTTAPLAAIFYLRHGHRNDIRPLKPTEFLSLAVSELVVPTPLLREFSVDDLTKITEFCTQLVSEVSCYELFFLPDKGILNFIESALRG